jgi:hypothetical protein
MGVPGDKESGDRWLDLLMYAEDDLVWHLLSAVMLLGEENPWWRKCVQDYYINPLTQQFFKKDIWQQQERKNRCIENH